MPIFRGLVRLIQPVAVPGVPRVPGVFALLALWKPGLVPPLLRWRSASRGLGLVVARLLSSPDESTGAVLQALGREHGSELRRQLDYGRNPLECARAVALANRLYDIDARVKIKPGEGAELATPGCPWSREAWWGPGPCGAFSRYEIGLVEGLNPAVRLRYLRKKTRGDAECVAFYTWREAAPRIESGGQ